MIAKTFQQEIFFFCLHLNSRNADRGYKSRVWRQRREMNSSPVCISDRHFKTGITKDEERARQCLQPSSIIGQAPAFYFANIISISRRCTASRRTACLVSNLFCFELFYFFLYEKLNDRNQHKVECVYWLFTVYTTIITQYYYVPCSTEWPTEVILLIPLIPFHLFCFFFILSFRR